MKAFICLALLLGACSDGTEGHDGAWLYKCEGGVVYQRAVGDPKWQIKEPLSARTGGPDHVKCDKDGPL